ncbi:MAG: hypothetical protein WC568_07330 [Candidatus Methanoperedens sp.]
MVNDLITSDEIKTLRDGAVVITLEMCDAIKHGKTSQILAKPIHLKSGYLAQMTMDTVDNKIIEHLSVSKQYSKTDPADAEIIANAVLGVGWSIMPSMLDKNILHFLKFIK